MLQNNKNLLYRESLVIVFGNKNHSCIILTYRKKLIVMNLYLEFDRALKTNNTTVFLSIIQQYFGVIPTHTM